MERDGVGWLAHYAHYMVGRGGPWGHRGAEDSVAIAGYDSLLPSQTRLESVLRNLEILSGGPDRLTTAFAGISISLWKLWRHPGKGRRGTCRNRRYHPTAN